jgi:multidrug efflux pump subunit AcrA (membrane-fusion protein)
METSRNMRQRILRRIGGTASRKNALFVLTAAAGLFGAATLLATAPEHATQTVSEKAWPVSTTRIEFGSYAPELPLFGKVESPRHVDLSSAISERIARVHVAEGDHVQAGEVLVTLDTAEAELQLRQRRAELANREAERDALETDFRSEREILEHLRDQQTLAQDRISRLKDMYSRQLVSTAELDTLKQEASLKAVELSRQQALVDRQPQRRAAAEAQVETARAALDAQQLVIERSTLRAPFDGRITQVRAADAEQVMAGAPLLSLFDSASLRVRARVAADMAAMIKRELDAGHRVTATLEEGDLELELLQVSAQVDAGSSGLDALFRLPPDSRLELGRSIALTVRLPDLEQVATVPIQSVHENHTVYRVVEQRLRPVRIENHGTRRRADGGQDMLISSSDLQPGDEILSSDLARARDGLLVDTLASAPQTGASDPLG